MPYRFGRPETGTRILPSFLDEAGRLHAFVLLFTFTAFFSPEDTLLCVCASEAALVHARSQRSDGQLITAGMVGYTMVVTGTGTTIEEAQAAAYGRVDKVVIPNGRYRNDIGARLIERDWAKLKATGWVE